MFIFAVILIFIVSFILALRSVKTIGDKPKVTEVKKSIDKDRIVFQTHSSSK